MMAQRSAKLLFVSAMACTLAACVNLGGKAPPSMLVLTPTKMVAGGTLQSGAAKDALVILTPEVPRKLETNRVPVQINNGNIAYLKDALWADKPARLMQMLIVETVSAANNRLVLNEEQAGTKAEQYLSGALLEFGLDSTTNQAVIIYDVVRLQNGKAIEKKRFEARINVIEITPAAASVALNDGANRIAAEIAAWLATAT
jgi:cholesterol transport system auxiliary component